MSVIISGDNGISDVDGSAGTPAIRGTDANTGIFFPAADTIAFAEGGAEAMRIDSSGNVGIGTTSPTSGSVLDVASGTTTYPRVRSTIGSAAAIFFQNSDTGTTTSDGMYVGITGAEEGVIWNNENTDLRIATNNTERARITSGGDLLVGATSVGGSEGINLTRAANTATYIYQRKTTQAECTWGFKSSTDANMYIGSGSTSVGAYGVYLTNQGNSWNAVSDERMKTIVEPIVDAVTKVSTLRSVIGYYNNDANQIRRPFLIAQDVQAVLPEAVNVQDQETGTLGMSYTDTIPLLVAAIKELKAINDAQASRIETLEAKVAALEANDV